MKKFARAKTSNEIVAQCKAQRLKLDMSKYVNEGSDFIVVSGGGAHALYNVCSGWFFGTTPDGTEFNSHDDKNDKQPWMQALLNFFYVPKAAA